MWDDFKAMCLKCVNSIPSRLISNRYSKPWIITNTKQVISKKKRLYNYARSSGSIDDWKAYCIAKAIAQPECQKAHKIYLTNPNQITLLKDYFPT